MNSFKKEERLCSKTSIEQLFRRGDSFFLHPFKIVYIVNGMTSDRILVSVPKRDFKRAVARNLLKRRIRESFRLNKNSVDCKQGYDIAFLFIAGEILKYEIINERVRECLERVHKDS